MASPKFLVYADPHICSTSSIIRGQGSSRLSLRLESLIATFDWMKKVAQEQGCSGIICLGDLFDAPTLSPDVLTMISQCGIESHIVILGNHDKYSADGFINAANIYGTAITTPTLIYNSEECQILALPNGDVIDLMQYVKDNNLDPNKLIVMSHNDIKGIFYGNYEMKVGYNIPDILQSCRLFMNGHIHTGRWLVKGRVINCGTVSGLNFNCQGAEWDPGIFILDTSDFSLKYHRNPYGYTFHQVEFSDRPQMIDYFRHLDTSKNYCLQIRVPASLIEDAREWLSRTTCVKHSRLLTKAEVIESEASKVDQDAVASEFNHGSSSVYTMLRDFVNENIDENRYDKSSVLNEINLMEAQG